MPYTNQGLDTKIFRIVHVDNLPLILANGIYSPNSDNADDRYINIGNEELIQDRGTKRVPVAPNGNLGDYVPFYFAPRSPMLYSINQGHGVYRGPQDNIVHLISDISHITRENCQFVFSNMHAKAVFADFYNNIQGLDNIDWHLMNQRYWNDTIDDNNRMHRRMAEFLVYNFVPANCIFQVGVMTQDILDKAEEYAEDSDVEVEVLLRREWYY